jgi:hypothetical protein
VRNAFDAVRVEGIVISPVALAVVVAGPLFDPRKFQGSVVISLSIWRMLSNV